MDWQWHGTLEFDWVGRVNESFYYRLCGRQGQFPQDFKSISSNRNSVCLFMSREANDDENDIYWPISKEKDLYWTNITHQICTSCWVRSIEAISWDCIDREFLQHSVSEPRNFNFPRQQTWVALLKGLCPQQLFADPLKDSSPEQQIWIISLKVAVPQQAILPHSFKRNLFPQQIWLEELNGTSLQHAFADPLNFDCPSQQSWVVELNGVVPQQESADPLNRKMFLQHNCVAELYGFVRQQCVADPFILSLLSQQMCVCGL